MRSRIATMLLAASAIAFRGPAEPPKGSVRVDGSSTVFPISEAVAEDFGKTAPEVKVTVAVSGTGGGFKRFCKGETDVSNASRPISRSEVKACADAKIDFIELPVAYDGLCIVVHPSNHWVKQLTVPQLRRIYGAVDTARTWKDLDPSWPDRRIRVFSPGTDSGTYDYFVEEVLGKEGRMRSDMSVSEDDNVLVTGVAGERDAIGFFGYAYARENVSRVRSLPIDGGKGPVEASDTTIADGSYTPFSRPLLIYVNRASATRPEVAAFVEFQLGQGAGLVQEVGYTPLPPEILDRVRRNWKSRRTGTQFLDAGGEKLHGPLTDLYR